MTDPTDRRVSIDANLAMSIDGVEATLVGVDSDLTLRTDEPAKLAAALRRTATLSQLRRATTTAPYTQLGRPTVTVEGPRGVVVTVAAGGGGRRGAVAPAGTTVRVHRPFDLVPPAVRWATAITATAALLLVVAWRRRTQSPRHSTSRPSVGPLAPDSVPSCWCA